MNQRPSKIVLCGGKSCCPEINFDDDGNSVITDDFGGSVKLTAEELSILLLKVGERLFGEELDAGDVNGASCCGGGVCGS